MFKFFLEGQLDTRKWLVQSGQDKYSSEVVLRPYSSTLTMLDGRGDSGGGGGNFGGGGGNADQMGYDDRGGGGGGMSNPAPSRDLDDEIPF